MKTKAIITLFVLSFSLASTPLRANLTEAQWISPWETFEEAFPKNLSLIRRISIEESWNRGFEELEKYSLLHSEWTYENDRLLFEKIQKILVKFGTEIYLENIPQLKIYMQNRIKLYSAALPVNVIQSYYFYLDFFPDDKRVVSLFQESFQKLSSDSTFSSDGEAQLFLYLIRDLNTQFKQVPLSYFKLLLNYCETFSVQSKTKQDALLVLLELFESKESQLLQIPLPEWDYLLARRSKLFKIFRKNKFSTMINTTIKDHAETNLYAHSILMQNKLWDFQILRTGLTWNSLETKKYIEYIQSSTKTQFNNSRPKETYQILFSQIEILRGLLDLKTSLDFQPNSIISKDQTVKWYQKLMDFHNQAMAILQLTQYSTSLIFQCYQQNLNTKTCQTYRDYLPLQSVKLANDSNEWNLNQSYVYVPPGKFEFEPNSVLSIKAEKIEFHPLAFIYLPSGSVNIEAIEMDSPWVDVSGREEAPVPPVISGGSRPWIKDASHCHIRQYIDGATLVSIPKKRCANNSSGSCGTKLEWTLFTIKNPYPKIPVCASNAIDPDKNLVGNLNKMLDLGQAPDNSSAINWINRANGSNGGKIILNVREHLANPLLLAQGANGLSGLNGQSSPLCNSENEFIPYKLVISQSEDEYNKWLDITINNPHVKITPIQSEIYHHIALLEILLPRTSGLNGGSGGTGGQIKLNTPVKFSKNPWRLKSFFLSGGSEGQGGTAGSCGPNPASDGKVGVKGSNGKFIINN